MIEVSLAQFKVIHHTLSVMIAVMGVATAFFLLQRSEVHARYRLAITLLVSMTLASTYGYYRLFESWNQAFDVVNGTVRTTGRLFDDAYRFSGWLFTAPLLVVALLLVLDTRRQARWQLFVPAAAAAGMVAVACGGQFVATVDTRLSYVLGSLGFFVAVLYHLYVSVAVAVHDQPGPARALFIGARIALLVAWSAYQLVWAMPLLGIDGTVAVVAAQLGYAGADLLALFGVGMLVLTMAALKSASEDRVIEPSSRPYTAAGGRLFGSI